MIITPIVFVCYRLDLWFQKKNQISTAFFPLIFCQIGGLDNAPVLLKKGKTD